MGDYFEQFRPQYAPSKSKPHPNRVFIVQLTQTRNGRVECQNKVLAACSTIAKANAVINKYTTLHGTNRDLSFSLSIVQAVIDGGEVTL